MKKLLSFFAVYVLLSCSLFAQLISFPVKNYYDQDEIKVTVISAGKFIVENSIRKKSEEFAQGGSISLGIIPGPGFYKFTFRLAGGVAESYGIWTGKKTDDITDGSVQKQHGQIANTAAINNFFDKLGANIAKIEFKEVLKGTLKEYATTHVISGTVTVAVCLSAGTVPAIGPICVSNVLSEAKDLMAIYLVKLTENMHAKAILTTAEKNIIVGIINSVSGGIDFFLAKGRITKLISAVTTATEFVDGNNVIKMAIKQESQLFSQTKVLLEVGKRL